MKEFLKELKEARVSSEKAKEYLNDYMTLLYKTQLKIYDQDGDKIDDIRLFVTATATPLTILIGFVSDPTVPSSTAF